MCDSPIEGLECTFHDYCDRMNQYVHLFSSPIFFKKLGILGKGKDVL
jgi:hypothetical protein